MRLPGGDAIIAECKWDEAAGPLRKQLDDRVKGFPEAIGLFGVLYPDRLKRAEDTRAELAGATDIRWWLHGSRGVIVSEPTVRNGSVADFADHVRALPLELEGVDRVAAAASVIRYALERAANEFGRHARIARRIADMIARTDREKNREAALRIGDPLWWTPWRAPKRSASGVLSPPSGTTGRSGKIDPRSTVDTPSGTAEVGPITDLR